MCDHDYIIERERRHEAYQRLVYLPALDDLGNEKPTGGIYTEARRR